jgi:hypothetical protein
VWGKGIRWQRCGRRFRHLDHDGLHPPINVQIGHSLIEPAAPPSRMYQYDIDVDIGVTAYSHRPATDLPATTNPAIPTPPAPA